MFIYKLILVPSLLIAVLVESVFISFPLVIILSILLFLADSSTKYLFYIFIIAFLLDILRVEQLGFTPLFIFSTLIVIDLYKKSFEVSDVKFIALITFVSSFIYARIASYNFNIIFFGTILVFLTLFLFRRRFLSDMIVRRKS